MSWFQILKTKCVQSCSWRASVLLSLAPSPIKKTWTSSCILEPSRQVRHASPVNPSLWCVTCFMIPSQHKIIQNIYHRVKTNCLLLHFWNNFNQIKIAFSVALAFCTLKNAGLFKPKVGLNMDKPNYWVKF